MTIASSTSQSVLVGVFWEHHLIIATNDAGWGLVEDNGFFRRTSARFGSVVGVIQADGDEVADMSDRRAKPRTTADQWQGLDLELGNLVQKARGKPVALEVGHVF